MNIDSILDVDAAWEPRMVSTEESVDPGRVLAFASLLDSGAPSPREGDALPPLWHWVALPSWPRSSEIDEDGHPRRGGLLPFLPGSRRMFAGGSITITRQVRVGERLRHQAIVESVSPKRGRNGDLVVVRVGHVFRGADDVICLEEKQDLVFIGSGPRPPRDHGSVPETVTAPVGPPLRRTAHGWDVVTDPTLLMRFSAVTANPHRIHYDWPYATGAEGYPGLVVQGPLCTLLLAETMRLEKPTRAPRHLQHRNMSPLFCGQDAQISLTTTPEQEAAVLRREGTELVTLAAQY